MAVGGGCGWLEPVSLPEAIWRNVFGARRSHRLLAVMTVWSRGRRWRIGGVVVASGVAGGGVAGVPGGGGRRAHRGDTAHLHVGAVAAPAAVLLHLHLIGVELPQPTDDERRHDGAVVVLNDTQHKDAIPAQVGGWYLARQPAHLGHAHESGAPEAEADVGEAVTAEGPPEPEEETGHVQRHEERQIEPDDGEDLLIEDVDGEDALAGVGAQAALDGRAHLAQRLKWKAGRRPPLALDDEASQELQSVAEEAPAHEWAEEDELQGDVEHVEALHAEVEEAQVSARAADAAAAGERQSTGGVGAPARLPRHQRVELVDELRQQCLSLLAAGRQWGDVRRLLQQTT